MFNSLIDHYDMTDKLRSQNDTSIPFSFLSIDAGYLPIYPSFSFSSHNSCQKQFLENLVISLLCKFVSRVVISSDITNTSNSKPLVRSTGSKNVVNQVALFLPLSSLKRVKKFQRIHDHENIKPSAVCLEQTCRNDKRGIKCFHKNESFCSESKTSDPS